MVRVSVVDAVSENDGREVWPAYEAVAGDSLVGFAFGNREPGTGNREPGTGNNTVIMGRQNA